MENFWEQYQSAKKADPENAQDILMKAFWSFGQPLCRLGSQASKSDLPFFLLALDLAKDGVENYLTEDEKEAYREIRSLFRLSVTSFTKEFILLYGEKFKALTDAFQEMEEMRAAEKEAQEEQEDNDGDEELWEGRGK